MSVTESLYGALLLTILYAEKFRGWRMPPLPGVEDYAWLIAFELALGLAPRPIAAVLSLVVVLIFLALWLDLILFRVFTIELGPGGIGTAVTSAVYRELTEMQSTRRFLRERLPVAALPIAALVIHAERFWASTPNPAVTVALGLHAERLWAPAPSSAVTVALGLYAAWASLSLAQARTAALALTAVWLAARLDQGLWSIGTAWVGVAGLFILSAKQPVSRVIRPFFGSRQARAVHAGTSEDEPLLSAFHPSTVQRSAGFGVLKGQSVVLWTIESMARDYLSAFSPGTAQTPFIDSLRKQGVDCQQHFALSPLTHNAHVLLYASGYGEERGFTPIQALRRAGYETIYLTSCSTRDYGLRDLLTRVGFDQVLDASALQNGSGNVPGDAALVTAGWERLAPRLLASDRWFLHVHTSNTHVPYRLSQPAQFRRFDPKSDLGRFLNGLEEADHILAQFFSHFRKLSQDAIPLLVVSADHGQSFGQFGYHSHGSAVVKEQVMVPCVFAHPHLAPGTVPYSSHLDVMPTILDLVGVELPEPVYGAPILGPRPPPAWLLWAGHPSRSRTSHFGLISGPNKFMFDWTVNRGYQLTWNDQDARELAGDEKSFYSRLISQVAANLGVQ